MSQTLSCDIVNSEARWLVTPVEGAKLRVRLGSKRYDAVADHSSPIEPYLNFVLLQPRSSHCHDLLILEPLKLSSQ